MWTTKTAYDESKKDDPNVLKVVMLGTASTGLILTANHISLTRLALEMDKVVYLNWKIEERRRLAEDVLGTAGATELIQDIAEKVQPENMDDDTWFYDDYLDIWFQAPLSNVLDACAHINEQFDARGFGRLKTFYSIIDVPELMEELVYRELDEFGFDCSVMTEEYGLDYIPIHIQPYVKSIGDNKFVLHFGATPHTAQIGLPI